MKTSFYRTLSHLGLTALILIPAASMAQPSSEGWKAETKRIAFSGTAVRKEERGVMRHIEIVYTGTEKTSGNVIFTCFKGRPSVNFAIRPVDMPSLLSESVKSIRRRSSDPIFTVDGEQMKSLDWTYLPVVGAFHARRQASFRMLYNAALLGSTVKVRSHGDAITLNLPKANLAFKNFGAECGLGLNADR